MKGSGARICTYRVAALARALSLAILFGGSSAIVFAAITLVKAAKAHGVPAAQAATANAPVFIHFSTILLVAGIALLASEAADYALCPRPSRLTAIRYLSSLLCVATTMIFALGIVPPLAELLPLMHSTAAAPDLEHIHASFHRLHEISRIVFGATIFFALAAIATGVLESAARTQPPPITLELDPPAEPPPPVTLDEDPPCN